MKILKIIFLVGAIQGFLTFLALLSFGKSHKKSANYYLSFAVLILTINLLIDYFFHGNEPFQFPLHSDFHALLGFTYGPLFYLYVRSLTGFSLPGKGRVFLYFLPFSLASTYTLLCVLPHLAILYRYFFVIEISSLLHVISFVIMSIRHLYRHEEAVKNSFSNVEKLSLLWLRFLTYSMGIILVIAFFLYFRKPYFDIVWVLVALLIYTMSYFTLRRPEIVSSMSDESRNGKYVKSSLNHEMIRESKLKIDKLMEEEKLFLDNEITLPLLAERISVPVHHLSQIINQAYHKNFYEFISSHRINTAQEMMLSPEYNELKVIDICYRVGFNTISAFNKSFKKITGLTPTQFRKMNSQT